MSPINAEDIKLLSEWKQGDFRAERILRWKKLSLRKRTKIVQHYKEERKIYLLESLSKDISEERRNEINKELDSINILYNVDTPPREWNLIKTYI